MVWRHDKKNGLIMLYGFKDENNMYFDAVLTLYNKHGITYVYGFLSKCNLALKELKLMWKKMREIIETEYMIIEVSKEHLPFYQRYTPIVTVLENKSFDGFETVIAKVKVKEVNNEDAFRFCIKQ